MNHSRNPNKGPLEEIILRHMDEGNSRGRATRMAIYDEYYQEIEAERAAARNRYDAHAEDDHED